MIEIRAFKEKEKEGGEGKPQLGGQWKVLIFGALSKVKKKHPFTSFHFLPPSNFT
jgi:hypothetical protein